MQPVVVYFDKIIFSFFDFSLVCTERHITHCVEGAFATVVVNTAK